MKFVKSTLTVIALCAGVFVVLAVTGFGQGGYSFGSGGGKPQVGMLELGRKTPPRRSASHGPRETVFDRFRALVGITPPGQDEAAADAGNLLAQD